LGVYGYLTLIAFVLLLVLATCATVQVTRMRNRRTTPVSEQMGSVKAVMDKVRKRESLSSDELDFAKRVIGDRRSLMAYSIPAALFAMGCFYVFGSLEHLHGAAPSERTFLGVIPMFTSTNLALRMLSGARLKGRLPKAAHA
jgi:Flp pilus assembly protein TadB